jgi:hypothetical protein
MKFRRLFREFGLAAALAAVASECGAQAPEGNVTAADRAAIAACMRDSADQPRACIGSIAVICARQTSGERRDTEIACTRREAAVWRERLDFATSALSQRLASTSRSRFGAVQRSWEEYVALRCAFTGEIETPARAPVMQAGCEFRAVAARAIEIETMARRRLQPAQPRPQLQR